MTNKFVSPLLFLLLPVLMASQDVIAQSRIPDLKEIVAPFQNKKKSKVLILGTFHFRDGGNDAFKPKYPVNIKSEKRQAEVIDLLRILKKFNPTKVSIENMPERQTFHDSLYAAFLNGKYEPGENEIYQVSYRLAKMMGHEKVYTIDAPARHYEEDTDLDSIARVLNQEKYADELYIKMLFNLYAREDSIKSTLPIKDYLRYVNNPEILQLELGHYLTATFKVGVPGNYAGPDNATAWWNRNLRIFANILQLAAESKEERVFVMIGAGHLQILRLLAKSCPDIEFIDPYEYLINNK